MGSSEVFIDHTDFWNGQDDNGPNIVNDATGTTNANILYWIANITNIRIELFTQNSSHSIPEKFDVSVATALHYYILLFKPETFTDIRKHTYTYAIFKQQ